VSTSSTIQPGSLRVAVVQLARPLPPSSHTVPDSDAGSTTSVTLRQALCCAAGVQTGSVSGRLSKRSRSSAAGAAVGRFAAAFHQHHVARRWRRRRH
jgi:hypothetical protein